MAEIRPLRAWRYNPHLSDQIEQLTSPLFDVVSQKQLDALYMNPHNSIHISVPLKPDPFQHAKQTLDQWKKEGIILQDPIPAIYVYYQHYHIPGENKPYCRKGFICNIRCYDWEDNVILHHENTMPDSVNDRRALLEGTEMHASPTHGLYTDPKFELEDLMDESMLSPCYETEDYQGVRDILSVIHDARAIEKFVKVLKDKQVILADGHHRYMGSLEHKHQMMNNNPSDSGEEGYHFHFMYLSNTEAGDFKILPTHRLIRDIKGLDQEKLVGRLVHHFEVTPLLEPFDAAEVIYGKKWCFGLIFKNSAYKISLRNEAWDSFDWEVEDPIRELDITVMHHFIIEKGLGIVRQDQTRSDHIYFDRNFTDCVTQVYQDSAQMAIITQEISIEDVKRVCNSGGLMPQKTTYFYPKVICGFLFSSIKEDEFELYHYSR